MDYWSTFANLVCSNSKWFVMGLLCRIVVWKLGDSDGDGGSSVVQEPCVHIDMGRKYVQSGMFSRQRDDEFVVVVDDTDSLGWRAYFLDLEASFSTQSPVVRRNLDLSEGPLHTVWCGDTLCALYNYPKPFLFDTDTTLRHPVSGMSIVTAVGPEHFGVVSKGLQTLKVYHTSDLSKPCGTHGTFWTKFQQESLTPAAPGIILMWLGPHDSTRGTSGIALQDAVTGTQLAILSFPSHFSLSKHTKRVMQARDDDGSNKTTGSLVSQPQSLGKRVRGSEQQGVRKIPVMWVEEDTVGQQPITLKADDDSKYHGRAFPCRLADTSVIKPILFEPPGMYDAMRGRIFTERAFRKEAARAAGFHDTTPLQRDLDEALSMITSELESTNTSKD
ncbi:hypothetical protein Pelo_1214 [Pelomyxa schiedti]|nr:hypothetical protein Pelo_1214 [Pelomyxa schiedti]